MIGLKSAGFLSRLAGVFRQQPRYALLAFGTLGLGTAAVVLTLRNPAQKGIEPVDMTAPANEPIDAAGLSENQAPERPRYTLVPPDADSTDMVRRAPWLPLSSDDSSGSGNTEGGAQETPPPVAEPAGDLAGETPPAPAPSEDGFKSRGDEVSSKGGGAVSGAVSPFPTASSLTQPEGAFGRVVAAAGQVLSGGRSIVRAWGGNASRQAGRSSQGVTKKQGLATGAASSRGDAAGGKTGKTKDFGLSDGDGLPSKDGKEDEGLPDCPAGTKPMMTGGGSRPWECKSIGGLGKDEGKDKDKDKDKDSQGGGGPGGGGGGEEECFIQAGTQMYKGKLRNGQCVGEGGGEGGDGGAGGDGDLVGGGDTPPPEETPAPPEETAAVTETGGGSIMTTSWSEAAQVVQEGAVKNCQVVNGKSTCVDKDNQPQEVSAEVALTEIRESSKKSFAEGTLKDCKQLPNKKFTCLDNSGKPQEVHWSVWGAYADSVDKDLAAAKKKMEESCQSQSSQCRDAKRELFNAQQKMDVLEKDAITYREANKKTDKAAVTEQAKLDVSWNEASKLIKDGALSGCAKDTGGRYTCLGKDGKRKEVSADIFVMEQKARAKKEVDEGLWRDCKKGSGAKWTCVGQDGVPKEVDWTVSIEWQLAQAQKTKDKSKENQGDDKNKTAMVLVDEHGKEALAVDGCNPAQGLFQVGSHCQHVEPNMAEVPDPTSKTGVKFVPRKECPEGMKFKLTNKYGPGSGECIKKVVVTTFIDNKTLQSQSGANTTASSTKNTSNTGSGANSNTTSNAKTNISTGFGSSFNSTNKTLGNSVNTQKTTGSTGSTGSKPFTTKNWQETKGKNCSFTGKGGKFEWSCQ